MMLSLSGPTEIYLILQPIAPSIYFTYFFAFGGGFYLFVQWNTVPTLSTEVVVNSYRTTTNDKASISLKLQKNYNRLSDFGNNSQRLIINFGSAPDTITHFLKQGESVKDLFKRLHWI